MSLDSESQPPTWAEMQALLGQLDWRDRILTLAHMPKPMSRVAEANYEMLLKAHAVELVTTHKRVLQ